MEVDDRRELTGEEWRNYRHILRKIKRAQLNEEKKRYKSRANLVQEPVRQNASYMKWLKRLQDTPPALKTPRRTEEQLIRAEIRGRPQERIAEPGHARTTASVPASLARRAINRYWSSPSSSASSPPSADAPLASAVARMGLHDPSPAGRVASRSSSQVPTQPRSRPLPRVPSRSPSPLAIRAYRASGKRGTSAQRYAPHASGPLWRTHDTGRKRVKFHWMHNE